MKTFILRDPKTRKISKSDFRDRIVHHALVFVIEPIFDKTFIYDSCANRKGKGNLFALERFYKFSKKVSGNGTQLKNRFNDANYVKGYCLKADIKHYFSEVNHEVLLNILQKKIADKQTIWLISRILSNNAAGSGGGRVHCARQNCFFELASALASRTASGMPLGNLTSQFFANVYLNELDYFVKHSLKAEYYIRYVDDFVILHNSKEQLEKWKEDINLFLKEKLRLELHSDKSKIIPLKQGVDFVGFRNFYYFALIRNRNIKKIENKIESFSKGNFGYLKLMESFEGWQAYSKWANSFKLRKKIVKKIYKAKKMRLKNINKFKTLRL